jgi:hypothetical protein
VSDSIFGPILGLDSVEDAVKATLKTWFHTYLKEVLIQRGIDDTADLPVPRTYRTFKEFDHYPDQSLPAVVIISPGTVEEPTKEGDGQVTACFRVGVAIINKAKNEHLVNRNCKIYASAARAILVQQRSLGGLANGVKWISEGYEEGPTDKFRSLGASTLEFDIDVPGIVNAREGPAVPTPPTPDDLPGSEWPTVLTTEVEVTRESIVEEGG